MLCWLTDIERAQIVRLQLCSALGQRGRHELGHSPYLAMGFASSSEKPLKLSAVILRSLLRGASFFKDRRAESNEVRGYLTRFYEYAPGPLCGS